MIFQGVDYIDPKLKNYATRIEENEIGLRVISGRMFKIPGVLRHITVSVTEPRRFNILEEFILRASKEMEPSPTKSELSKMFGLDKLFIDSTCKDLQILNLITIHENEKVALSEDGDKYYQLGFIPRPSEEREVNLAYLAGSNKYKYINSLELPNVLDIDKILPGTIKRSLHNETNIDEDSEGIFEDSWDELEEIEKFDLIVDANSSLTLNNIKAALNEAGLNWDRPDEGYLLHWNKKIKTRTNNDHSEDWIIFDDDDEVDDFSDYDDDDDNINNIEGNIDDNYSGYDYDDEDDINNDYSEYDDIENVFYYPCGVLVIEDTSQNSTTPMANFSIRIFNFLFFNRDTLLEDRINKEIIQKNIFFETFFPSEYRDEILDQIYSFQETIKSSPIKQNVISLYQEEIIQERKLQKEIKGKQLTSSQLHQKEGKIKYLWGEKIKPKFLQTLREARHSIILVSPWITEEVVDQEFTTILRVLASKRVAIVIGWGISKNQATEDRVPSEKLLKSLMNIRSPEGFPMVFVWWLGNIHNKDFLVDYKINISGSFNYLSYRGDRDPRGESVHYVSFPEPVNEALNSIEPLFDRTCTSNWNKFNKDIAFHINQITQCCISWVIVRRIDTAFTKALSILDKKNEGIDVTNPFNGVCATLTRLPADELAKLFLLEKIQFSLTQAKKMDLEINLLKNNEYLKWLLGCYAINYKEDVRKWLLENNDLFVTLGIIIPNLTLESAIDQLIDIANKKKTLPGKNIDKKKIKK